MADFYVPNASKFREKLQGSQGFDGYSSGYSSGRSDGSSSKSGFYTPSASKFRETLQAQRVDTSSQDLIDNEKLKRDTKKFFDDKERDLYARLLREGKTEQAERFRKIAEESAGLQSRAGYEQSILGKTLNTLASVVLDVPKELYNQTRVAVQGGMTTPQGGAGLTSPELVQNQTDYINSEVQRGTISRQRGDELIKELRGKTKQASEKLSKAEEEVGVKYNPSAGAFAAIDVAGALTGAGALLRARTRPSATPVRQEATQLEQAAQEAVKDTPIKRSYEELDKAAQQSALDAKGRYDETALQKALSKSKAVYDPSSSLKDIDNAYAKSLGFKNRTQLPASERLELMYDKGINSSRQADEILKTPTRTGQSAYDLIQKYGAVKNAKTKRGKAKAQASGAAEFNRYANNKFDADYRARNGRPIQSDVSDEDLAARIAGYEAKNPEAITDIKTLKAINDEAIDLMASRGVITRAEADIVKSSSEFAVPLQRLFSDDLQRVQIGGKSVGSIGRQTVLQALEGNSNIPLEASFSPLIKRIEKAVSQSNRNELAQKVLERAQQGFVKNSELVTTPGNKAERAALRTQGATITKEINDTKRQLNKATGQEKTRLQAQLDALTAERKANNQLKIEFGDTSPTGRQTISGFVDGEKFQLDINPQLATALQGLDVLPQSAIVRAAKATTTPFRTAWTGFLNPIFTGVSSVFYDLPVSAILPLINNPRAFASSLGPKALAESFKSVNSNSAFQRALAREGAQLVGGSQVIQDAALNAANIASKSNFFKRAGYLATNPKQALESLDQFTGKLAGITRTRVAKGYYQAAKKAGRSEEDAIKEAVWAYNNILPNYARANQAVKNIDSFLPYVNASLAGTRSMLDVMKGNPGRAAAVFATVSAPLVGATAYNLSLQEGQDFYQDMADSGRLDQLDRDIYIVLPGASKDAETGEWSGIVQIPIPPELRSINKMARESTQNFVTGEGQSPTSTATALFDFFTGGVRTVENPGVDTLRILSNVNPQSDLFKSEPLVKGDMANLPKDQQVFAGTSEAGKFFANNPAASWLREVTGVGVSPVQADALLGQFGFVGNLAKGRSTGEQLEKRFTNAYGQTTGSRYYKEYALVDALRNSASKEITQDVKAKNLDGAFQRAEEFNQEVDDAMTRYARTYGADSELLTELNNLKIKLTDRSIKARLKQ